MRALGLTSLLLFAACGPTIGDPCTTATDCATGTCVNRDFAPGGYCSLKCNPPDCPAGTLCVNNVLPDGSSGCMRTCTQAADCRTGYGCHVVGTSASSVCIGN